MGLLQKLTTCEMATKLVREGLDRADRRTLLQTGNKAPHISVVLLYLKVIRYRSFSATIERLLDSYEADAEGNCCPQSLQMETITNVVKHL